MAHILICNEERIRHPVGKNSHPVDEVQVPRVVGSDDGKDVPVVLLHDVEHDRGLLLYRRPKLEEHGVVILQNKKETCRQFECMEA